ncbi:MAG: hypothetical protein JXA42_25100 [Anaerolineales bacterium]|nr:hypothetical protein [Anaerolineales bacterium]
MSDASYSIKINGDTTSIGNAAELSVALDVLQGQHDRIVLQQLEPFLTEIIQDAPGLYAIFKVVNHDDQLYLIDALGSDLEIILKRANKLRDILAMLADERVEQHLIQTLGSNGLRALVNSAQDLVDVLEWVYGRSDHLVLSLLGDDYLKKLFQSGYELALVLHTLDQTRQTELFNLLGWQKILSLIHDIDDLAYLSRALPCQLSTELMERLTKNRIWELVRDEKGLDYLSRYLDRDEVAFVRDLLEDTDAK